MARPRKNAGGTGSGSPSLSSGQASYVLDRLIAERRISPGEINRYVSEMGREISDLEQRLARLREAAGPAAAAAIAGVAAGIAGAAAARRGRRPGRPGRPPGSGRKPGRPGRPPGRPAANAGAGANAGTGASGAGATAAKGGKRGRRKSAITPEQLASRQLQGRYLALVRQFAENRRTGFAKTAKEKGREAAIKEMQDALKK